MTGRRTLEGIFRPGWGAAPYLAGREEELETLEAGLLGFALRGEPPPSAAVLIGPRGNGKTALLNEFDRRVREKGAFILPAAQPDQLRDGAAIGRWLLSEAQAAKAKRRKLLPRRFQAGADVSTSGAGANVAVEWKDEANGKPAPDGLADALAAACAGQPRVALFDEAHTTDPDALRVLLNAAQNANGLGAPFLLVLAGTPHLRAALSKADASFWSRCKKIGVGRIAAEAVRDALRIPLAEHGVEFDEDALNAVVSESQNYPYFVQLWGEGLCAALNERGTDRIDLRVVEAARAAFARDCEDYYEERYGELDDANLLEAAEATATAFESGGEFTIRTLRNEIARAANQPSSALKPAMSKMSELGFVWRPPGGNRVEPGIPSLMAYALEQREIERARDRRTQGRAGR